MYKRFMPGVIDSLVLLVPSLAFELDAKRDEFNRMNSIEKAQWIVDHIQDYMRKKLNLSAY